MTNANSTRSLEQVEATEPCSNDLISPSERSKRTYTRLPHGFLPHREEWLKQGWRQRLRIYEALARFSYLKYLTAERLIEQSSKANMGALGGVRRVQLGIQELEDGGLIRRDWNRKPHASAWGVEICGVHYDWSEQLDGFGYVEEWKKAGAERQARRERALAKQAQGNALPIDLPPPEEKPPARLQNDDQRWSPEAVKRVHIAWSREHQRHDKRPIDAYEIVGALDLIQSWAGESHAATALECLGYLEAAAMDSELWNFAKWPLSVAQSATSGAKYFARWKRKSDRRRWRQEGRSPPAGGAAAPPASSVDANATPTSVAPPLERVSHRRMSADIANLMRNL